MSKLNIGKITANNLIVADGEDINVEKVKCTCRCHGGKNVKHIKPCCKDGYKLVVEINSEE